MEKENKSTQADVRESNFWFALSVAGQLGWVIAIPLVLLAVLGRYLDIKYNSSPILLLAGILLSIFVSSWAVYFKIIKIFAQVEKNTRQKILREKPKK